MTVASIVVCLAVLAVLVVLGFVYQRRWKRLLFSTDSSPFQKFHFRTSGLDTGAHHERTNQWPEDLNCSDRKFLFGASKELTEAGRQDAVDGSDAGVDQPHLVVVDHNDNRPPPYVDTASYSMKEHLISNQEL